MSSKVDFPKDPNSPDSIQILIDVFEETRDHHQHHQHQQQQQQQSSAHQSKQQLSKLKQQQQQQLQKQHQNSTVAAGKSPTDASGGNGYLGVQENFRRERRNSWCTSRPSETLANLKRKWFAGLTGNGNVKALTGDDNDAIEPDKSKSHSLTSLDGEGSTSEDEKLSTNQKDTTEFLDRPSSSTLCSSPVPGYRGDDRFLGDDLFSGRNARSEQDVRGHEEKGIEDKLIEVPDFPQLMGERFSLESDNLFAVKTKKMASSASTDVQASSPQEGGNRCTSPTPLRGCPDKVNRSDHPNLDLLVARHKSEGSLQRYPFKELKVSSTTQRKSSVLSKINSYRNSKKNNKAPPVETHNFVSISSSLSSSSSVSHFSAISPSSVCEVCNKPFTNKKIPLKCLDCGLLTHQDNSCKEQAVTYTCSADESRTISNASKSEEVSDPNVKFNKGNSSATTTESDSLDLPDLSLDETDAVFVSSCPPGITTGTGSNTTGTSSATGIPTVIGGNDDEEAWSLTVDEHVINSMSQSEIKRQNLIWELIRNEKHHYRILKMMLKIFVCGLKTEVGLDSAMVNQLFPGLDGLIVVHGHILKALLKQQSIRQDRRVDDLSSVLLEQFGGSNGHQMEVLYGEFCSQHERAINLYKELRRCDRKFQSFINKCVGIVACERRGIDSCILTVTQRLTKYPLLVDQILKYTEDEKERKGLSDFLHLVRSIISAVNDRVDFVAKKERFEEIFDKLDSKSTTTLGSRTIKKVDILAMEKYLRFHGWIKLKTARGRTVDSLVVVLTDWVVMLSENNHKYYFCNIDNKSSMIPLSQLLVREKDDKHEGRNFFLISSNRDAPAEMYELVCKSNSELKYWTSVLRQATALCASKTGTPLDLMSLVKSDQTQLISLIETMQTRDEEVKTSLNQKLSAVEEFYKTLDKLLPSGNMSDAIKQMTLAKRQHLSPEDLVLSVHGQETNLIASLQCGAVSDPARRSLSKDRESSSLESLNSRRTSTASLFSKVSHSSSFRNIADPSLSSSTDPSLHHSSSDGVDGDGMEQVETAKVKRKTSDASVVDTKYSARATMGMLPGFLSIFCKEKDDSQDGDELHKHRKQSSLTLQQQSFNNSFQQQQQQQPQQLPVQTVLPQQSNLQHTAQQSNKISTNNTSEQQQQATVNNYSSENYNTHKQNLSSEAEERLCYFLNSVHNLSAMVLEMSTEAKKKEVQIICMTRQLEKFEKQSYPMDQQMEELRSVQNQVQLEKFQLQELRSKHQEDVDKLNEDLKQQNATFELQRAEIKSQKDELQRQRDALQRQIDLFEENKSSFSVRQQQQQQHQQQQGLQQLSKDQQDESGSLKSLKRHERNHSNPFSLAGKPLSAIIADSGSSRSGSPCRNAPTFGQQQGSLSNNSTMTRSQQQQQQQQNNKQVRPGMTSELFEPPVDEKNGVLVTKKDAVPLLPVHLVSAKNESKLDRHTSAIIADDSAQQLTQLGPVKQMFPAKLATTPTSNQSKQKQQTTITTTTTTTTNNNNNRSSNKITSTQKVVSKADDKRQSEVEASKPTPSMFFHNRPGNHTTKSGSMLPLYLAEKTRILPSSSSSSLQHCHFNNNNMGNNKSSSSSNSLEDENRQQHLSNNSCNNGNNINPKTGRSLFGTTKKLSQLLSPSSSSSSSPPLPPPPQSALEAMMTSTLLSPRVQFLSFPNFSGQITSSSSPPPPPPLPSSSTIPPIQSSSSSSLPSSSSSSSSSTVTNSFKSKTSTTRTSTAKATNKVAGGGSDDDDEIIFI